MAESKPKANAGDLILVTNAMFPEGNKYANGDILTVTKSEEAYAWTQKGRLFNEEYEVVTDNISTILSNLVRRVSSLEDQLRMTQGNVEVLAQENAALAQEIASLDSRQKEQREIIESNLADITFLDERTQTHNISVNLRIDREADVSKIAEEMAKLIAKGGDLT